MLTWVAANLGVQGHGDSLNFGKKKNSLHSDTFLLSEIQTTPIPLWSPSCLDCVRWFCLGLIVSLFYVSPFPLVMHPRLNSQRPQLLEMRPRLTKNGLVVVGHQS